MPLEKGFIWPVRVYYEDTDSGGIVYFANYQKFMERARTEWLRSLGVEQDVLKEKEKTLFAVRHTAVDYNKPARFNDALIVLTTVLELRKVSITFEQKIYLQKDFDALGLSASALCRGLVKVASLDRDTFKPKKIPSHLVMEFTGAN